MAKNDKFKHTKNAENAEHIKQERIKRIVLWLLFGVLISIIPIVLALVYDLISGYSFSAIKMEYLSDFILVIVAVAANVCNASLSEKIEWVWFGFSIIALIYGIGLYSFLYRRSNPIMSSWVNGLIVVSLFIFLFISLGGLIIESSRNDK